MPAVISSRLPERDVTRPEGAESSMTATTVPTPTTPPPSATTVSTSTTPATSVASPAPALIVHPFGSRSNVIGIGVIDANVTTLTSSVTAGDVVLTYELQIGFDPHKLSSIIEAPAATSDGQLTIETGCATPGCLGLRPVNDRIQTEVELTVRRTTSTLTPGEHDAPFKIHFTDGTIEDFSVALYAEPAPSEAMSTRATFDATTSVSGSHERRLAGSPNRRIPCSEHDVRFVW